MLLLLFQDVPAGREAGGAGYGRGVFVRALRGSSIDVGLFHDDQRRSLATFEAWFNAREKVSPPLLTDKLPQLSGNIEETFQGLDR